MAVSQERLPSQNESRKNTGSDAAIVPFPGSSSFESPQTSVPCGTPLKTPEALIQYFNTPAWRHEVELSDGTSGWEYGPTFFEELDAEDQEKDSPERSLRSWADTWQEFPGSFKHSPAHILEDIHTWNAEHPKKQIKIDFLDIFADKHKEQSNVIVEFPERPSSFAADE